MVTEQWCEKQVREWLGLKMVTGRYSTILLHQFAYHLQQRTLHVHCIYDELDVLERPHLPHGNRTKPASPFTGRLLRGLWHKHFFQPFFLMQNIENYHRTGKGASSLSELVSARAADEADVGRVAHEVVISAYQSRAQSRAITGEWIVYAPVRGVNYYLTLGHHNEDAAIAERVRVCSAEFPEILEVWNPDLVD